MLHTAKPHSASTASTLATVSQKRIQLTPKQANIYVYGWQHEARYRVACCGRRFGKTYLMMEELRRAVRLAVERDVDTDMEIWYAGITLKQAEKNFWKRALRACPESWVAHINNSKHTITYKSGHVFRLVGLEDYDALRGSGLFFFMGDEFADTKPAAWTEVIRPMLSTCDGNAILIGTPKGYNHFHDWFTRGQPGEGRDPRTMSWHYTTLESGNVPLEEIEEARSRMDARTFRQEYEATFESYAGLIYYAFDRRHNIAAPPWGTMHKSNRPNVSPYYNPSLPVHVGLDFNIDPMTAHVYQEAVVQTPRGPIIVSYQIDEIHILSSNTYEMGNEIAERYAPDDPAQRKRITIYPDPAGAGRRTASPHGVTDVTILRSMGFSVFAMSNAPLVRDRINIVNGRFCAADGTRSLYITPNCVKSIQSAERQAYKEGTSEPDKKSGFDHDNDATGYYVYTRFAHQKTRPEHITHMAR